MYSHPIPQILKSYFIKINLKFRHLVWFHTTSMTWRKGGTNMAEALSFASVDLGSDASCNTEWCRSRRSMVIPTILIVTDGMPQSKYLFNLCCSGPNRNYTYSYSTFILTLTYAMISTLTLGAVAVEVLL